MKGLKYISLFFVYPIALITLGFVGGVTCVKVFYPGTFQIVEERSDEQAERVSDDWQAIIGTPKKNVGAYQADHLTEQESSSPSLSEQEGLEEQERHEGQQVSSNT